MKKVLTFLFALMLSAAALQVSAQALGEYQFSTGTDATKWITLTTTTSLVSPGQGDYGASTVQDIGFSFNFGGSTYTQFSVNTDGNLCFGSTVTGTSNYSTPFSATNANINSPKINMFGCDGFLADNGYIYHEVVGTAPDRICVIEFATSTYTSTSRSAVLKWQVQLFEGSNDIQIVYPSTAPSMTPAVVRQQGMCTDATDIVLINANHTISTYGAGVSTNNVDINTWPDVDRYYLFTIPTDLCIRPGNLVVSNITTTSADFSWTPMGTESSWEVFITDVDSVPDENTVATATVTDTFYNIYGLTAATAYHAFVRANCGSNYSNWRSIDFFSACPDYATIPYQENFDDYGAGGAAYYPQCWSRITNYSTQYPYISSSSAYSAPGNLYFYSSSASNYYSMAITPEIDTLTTPINTLTVNFLIKKTSTSTGYGALQVGVMTDPTDISTFTAVRTFTGSELTSASTWYEVEIPMTSYAGYGSYFALYKPGDVTGYTYVDNFRVYATPTCLKPVNVAVSNITDNSADIDWTPRNDESAWTVVVVPHGDDVTTGTPEYAYQHPYSISNLTDNTQYDVYVKSDCGGEESDWANIRTFTTKCLPTDQIPFVEDFATATYGTGTAAYPNCWTRHQIGTTSVYPYVSGTYGTGSLYFYSSTGTISTYAASQALDLSQETPGSLVLSCDLYKTSSDYGRMDIGYMTDADDINTFVALKSVYPGDLELVNNWYTFNVVLPAAAYNNTNVYLAFVAPAGGTNYVYLDNVSLDYIPTCSDPSNLTITNVAGTSALVSWTAAEFGDPDYNVEYSEAGQDNWTSVLVSGNTSVFITGLTEQTAYDVRVTSECTDATVQPTPITGNFTTPCLAGGTVAIGNGTTSNYYIPVNNFYRYTYSQQIFLSSEMNGATTINSVSFEYNYATAMSSKTNVNIYLKHTTKSAFTSTSDYESITGAQLVYSGNLNCTQGWNTFTFDSVFAYNGTDNLMLIIDDNSNGYDGSSYVFKVHSAGAYRSLYYYSDSNNPDPSNPTAVTTTSSYSTGNRSNVKFGGACDSLATCIAPNAMVTAVDNESITIDWAAGNNETSWELEYKLASENDWTSEGTVTTAPYILTGLTSASAYQIRMRSDCGAGDYSDWKGLSATTECDPINVPYLQNFDGTTAATGAMVPCWTRNTNYSTTAYPYLSTTQHVSGNNAVYFYATSTAYSYIASPRFDDAVLMDSLMVQFQAYKTSAAYFIEVGIMTDPQDASTFVPVGSFSPTAASTWELGEIRTSGYTGNGHYVALRTPQWITNYMYIDDINIDYIPSCLHVEDVHVVDGSITANDATVAWTPGADEPEWQVVYGPAGTITDLSNEMPTIVTEDSIMLTNLTPNTLYEVFVKAVCSNGESSGWMSTSFYTNCVAMTTLPFVENFDGVQGSTSTTVNNLPNCWNYYNSASTSSGYPGYPIAYNSSTYAASGTNSLRFYTGTYSYYGDQYAILPEIDVTTLPLNTLQLTFDARAYSTSYITNLYIGTMSNPGNVSTFTPFDTVVLSATTYATYHVDFSNYVGTDSYIAFYVKKPASSPIYQACYIDNISIDHAPGCSAPTNLTIGTLTGSSADFSWSDDPSQSAWEVYVYAADQTPDFTQAVSVSTNSYSATGLTQNTSYNVYVRTECADGSGYSNWIHTTLMTISDNPAHTPYFNDWSDATENVEWALLNGSQTNKWFIGMPSGETDSVLFISETGTSTTYNISSASAVWAYRDIQFGNGSEFNLSFNWKAYGESSLDYLKVFIGSPVSVAPGTYANPDGATLLSGNYLNLQTGWQHFSTILDASYANTTQRLYFLWRNDSSVGTAPAAVVDSIQISVSDCGRPINVTASNISTTSFDVTFTPASTADAAWEYVVCATGANPDNQTPDMATATTFSVSGLTPATTYDVYVRTSCAAGGSSAWSDVLTVNTECEALTTLPYTQNFDNATGSTTTSVSVNNLPNCWDNIAGTYSSYAGYPIVYTSSTYAASGSNAMRFYTGTSTSIDYGDQYAVLPPIDAAAYPMNNLMVSFDARKNSTSYASFTLIVGVMNDAVASSFVPVDTLVLTDATYNSYEVSFNNYTGTGTRIAFMAPHLTSVSYNTGYVDNIVVDVIPTCPNPSSLAVTSTTNSSVTLAWTENGSATSWEIEYGQTGYTLGSGTVVTATANPFTVTGLTTGDTYDFYLRSVCGASEFSNWRGPVSATPGSFNMPTSGTATVTMCGGVIYDDGGATGDYSTSVNSIVIVNPETPGAMVQLQGTVDVEDDFDFVNIYDGTTTTGTLLFSSANSSVVNVTSTTGSLTIEFTSDGSVVYSGFALTVSCTGGTTPTTCDAPTNVAASNITENAANITWTAGGTETAWNLQYKAASANDWSNSIAVTGTPSHNLTGLTAATAYDVRVQADCGAGETSTWATATFTTANAASDPCEAPTNMTATGLTTESAVLDWNQADATVNSWTINYKKASDATWTTIDVTSHPFTLTGLEYNTTYNAKVAANCDGTLSDFTSAITFKTAGEGVNDYTLANSISLYPNPTSGEFRIQNAELRIEKVEVYDVYGKLLNMVEVNDNQVTMNASNYAAGMYFVRIYTANGTATKTFVKK